MMSLLAKRVVDNQRTFVYSFVGAGTHAGTLFNGLIGSLLLEHSGWRTVFYLIGQFYFAVAFWCLASNPRFSHESLLSQVQDA